MLSSRSWLLQPSYPAFVGWFAQFLLRGHDVHPNAGMAPKRPRKQMRDKLKLRGPAFGERWVGDGGILWYQWYPYLDLGKWSKNCFISGWLTTVLVIQIDGLPKDLEKQSSEFRDTNKANYINKLKITTTRSFKWHYQVPQLQITFASKSFSNFKLHELQFKPFPFTSTWITKYINIPNIRSHWLLHLN